MNAVGPALKVSKAPRPCFRPVSVTVLSSTLYKICSRPRPENLVCGDFVQSFLEG